MPRNKIIPIDETMSRIRSGRGIAVGGSIGEGNQLTLIDHIKRMDVKYLTIHENDASRSS